MQRVARLASALFAVVAATSMPTVTVAAAAVPAAIVAPTIMAAAAAVPAAAAVTAAMSTTAVIAPTALAAATPVRGRRAVGWRGSGIPRSSRGLLHVMRRRGPRR